MELPHNLVKNIEENKWCCVELLKRYGKINFISKKEINNIKKVSVFCPIVILLDEEQTIYEVYVQSVYLDYYNHITLGIIYEDGVYDFSILDCLGYTQNNVYQAVSELINRKGVYIEYPKDLIQDDPEKPSAFALATKQTIKIF